MKRILFIILILLTASLVFSGVDKPKECEKHYVVMAKSNNGNIQSMNAICEFAIPEKNIYCIMQIPTPTANTSLSGSASFSGGGGGTSCVKLDNK